MHVGSRNSEHPEGAGRGSCYWHTERYNHCGQLPDRAMALGEAHCQTMAPAQQGESWGHKHSNLSFLPSVIFYWDFPLVDPDWKPADKGAECHSLLSSASQGTEQSG